MVYIKGMDIEHTQVIDQSLKKFVLAQHWWALVLRGLFAVVFGILTFVWPQITLEAFIIIFAVFAIINGIFTLSSAASYKAEDGRAWISMVQGLFSLIAGIVILFYPLMGELFLYFIIVGWAIVSGAFEITLGLKLNTGTTGKGFLIFSGTLSIIFGILLAVFPAEGIIAVLWLIATYAIILGVTMIILAFGLKKWQGKIRNNKTSAE